MPGLIAAHLHRSNSNVQPPNLCLTIGSAGEAGSFGHYWCPSPVGSGGSSTDGGSWGLSLLGLAKWQQPCRMRACGWDRHVRCWVYQVFRVPAVYFTILWVV